MIFAAVVIAVTTAVAAQQPTSSQRPSILGTPFQFPRITYECGSIDTALTVSLKVTKTECPIDLLAPGALTTAFGRTWTYFQGLLGAFNPEGAVVALHEPGSGDTISFSGTIDHIGHQDDTIFWGL